MKNPIRIHFDAMRSGAEFSRNVCGGLAIVGFIVLIISFFGRTRLRWQFLIGITAIGACCAAIGMCCMAEKEQEINSSRIGESLANRGCTKHDDTCSLRQLISFEDFAKNFVDYR